MNAPAGPAARRPPTLTTRATCSLPFLVRFAAFQVGQSRSAYGSMELALQVSRGLQLQSLWRIPTAAAGYNTCSVALQRNRLIRSTAGVKPQVTYSRQR